ncbi:DUF4157 domain-containing protein [Actinomycetospora lutea]|uniref:eCIS core domain-containing protein n=1 Tax=Actinomycetospora lutea TaxID=663604 RepID=UPI002365F0A7|nr:DUF4157 domain-containing protein [Actinomycetospora lutea]MDD7942419.1 DUF4157 domain-containing protein [Actinomycetospora lutea]
MRRLAQAARSPGPARRGTPMTTGVRTEMEHAFGVGLGHVRVHDGPAADTAAQYERARAFAVGDTVTFAQGQYRPHTPDGRGLLVHEVAHVLQGGAPDDAHAETEADNAVRDVAAGGRPRVVHRAGTPRTHRASVDAPPPPAVPAVPSVAPGPDAATTEPATAAPTTATSVTTTPGAPAASTTAGVPAPATAVRLPPGLEVVVDDPPGLGTTQLVVRLPTFALPVEKGAGSWVNDAYQEAASGGRLVFTPVITGSSVAAYKEGGEDYKSVWLGKFGFTTTAEVADAFTKAAATNADVKASLADPGVAKVVTGLASGLTDAGCDVDHIVEKQIGGTSVPSNLQLLVKDKNRTSGKKTYEALAGIVGGIRDPAHRGPGVRRLQLRVAAVTVPPGTPDPSFVVERHLRAKHVVGSAAVAAKSAGKAVDLRAGGVGETVALQDTGVTPLAAMSRRIVPGMRLTQYHRGKGGASSPADKVDGELDSRAVKQAGAGAGVKLDAELAPATAGTPVAPVAPPAGAAPDPTAAPPGESRRLRLDKAKNAAIAFFYPYLSPGTFTSMTLDDQGQLKAVGTIRSSVPFLGTLKVELTNEDLRLVAPIPATKLVSPLPGVFRFTGGELGLQLSPELLPSGTLTFSVGPAAAPALVGDLRVELAQGTLLATGTLRPARKLPGIDAAAGSVRWRPDIGWSGAITAAASSIPRSTANVELGFRTAGGRFEPYASGGIDTSIRSTALHLGARWDAQGLSYSGSATVSKPLPFVEQVRLGGRFNDRGMWLEGDAAIRWKNLDASMHVGYSRKEDEEEGRFSGTAAVAVKTPRADGTLTLTFDDDGRYWGKGTIAFQVTRDIRPVLGVELTKDHRVKISGQVSIGDVPLTRRWPSPEGGRIPIISGVGLKFDVPTPVPGLTAFAEIRGSLGVGYGVGPIVLTAVVFAGELFPLEDDPQIKANLTGALVVPAYAELYGTFGAYIGLEVALGAAGAKGGIDISPRLRLTGEGRLALDASYDEEDGFAFSTEATVSGQLNATVDVDLKATLYGFWGLVSHTWTYRAGSVSAQLGPTITLKLGEVGYAKGQITWPSVSDIAVEPRSVDPLAVIKEMLGRGEEKEG